MAIYNIKNPAQAQEDSEKIINASQRLSESAASLSYALNEIKSYWEQESPDAASYSNSLQNDIDNLTKLVEGEKQFGQAILNYSIILSKISNKSAPLND